MRTTLSLDDDVAAKLQAEVRRSGRTFKAAVNELLRLALNSRSRKAPTPTFTVRARDLGDLRPGLSLDNVGELLERAEGPGHR
ncbi:MAG: ribbon-helix-helix protein, CopG family [Candidatus Binatia bacterium]